MSRLVTAVALTVLTAGVGVGAGGCRGGLSLVAQPGAARKLPPVRRDARSEFDAGVRLMRLGAVDLRLAQARFKRAVELDPNFWEAWYNLGLLHVQLQQLTSAARAFRQAQAIQPAALDAIVALADVEHRLGRTSQAVQLLRNAIRVKDDPLLRKRLCRLLRQARRYGEAINEARAILARRPRDIEAYNLLALTYHDQKRYDMAELVLRKALAIDDKDAHSYNNLGLIALARGRDQEAFAHFDKATTLAPRLVRARLNKAMVLLECGEYAKALEDLQRAVEADAGSLEARVALGVALRGLKRYSEAARSWEAVLDVDPRHAAALYNLGVLFTEHQREPARAKTFLTRFMNATRGGHPKRSDVQRRLRELKMSLGGPRSKPKS